jgi:hypothetical protein
VPTCSCVVMMWEQVFYVSVSRYIIVPVLTGIIFCGKEEYLHAEPWVIIPWHRTISFCQKNDIKVCHRMISKFATPLYGTFSGFRKNVYKRRLRFRFGQSQPAWSDIDNAPSCSFLFCEESLSRASVLQINHKSPPASLTFRHFLRYILCK